MVEFQNIEIRYGDFVAVQNLNLTIKEGEFFTFLGPSGCGKTTTLRSLVGLVQPSGGKIFVDGVDITNTPVEKRQIGMVFQSYALFPTMTVYENIAFGLKVKRLSKEKIRKKVYDVAKKVEINEKQLERNVAELSGGQQQRVALARAIVLEPKILCLDEPLSNLDAKLRVGLRGELKRLQKTLGITTLYVTHDQEEALTLSDSIAVFNNGRVEQVGTAYEIYNHSASAFVCDFIGDINRMNGELISLVNQQSDVKLDEKKEAFVRIERMTTKPRQGGRVKLNVRILDYEYNGVLTKYNVEAKGQKLKYMELNSGQDFYKQGEDITLYVDPEDIMQF